MPGKTYEKVEAFHEIVLPDAYFESHTHDADQLAWIPGGARIRVGDSSWHLHGDHFAWIPALTEHEMQMVGALEMFSLYLDPSLRPSQPRWTRPLVLPMDPVAGSLMQSLSTRDVGAARLATSLALLEQILLATDESYDALTVPVDPRARVVAEAILDNPQDDRDLTQWAQDVGVSTKTLHRAFQSDTGLTFTAWRTRARIYASERFLTAGHSVHETAELTGYATATGFIKAFRHVFGSTPATYIRAKNRAAQQRPSTADRPSRAPIRGTGRPTPMVSGVPTPGVSIITAETRPGEILHPNTLTGHTSMPQSVPGREWPLFNTGYSDGLKFG